MSGEHAIRVELSSLEDLARLAATFSSVGSTVYIIHFREEGGHVYGLLTTYRDYFKLYGLPLFYYFKSQSALQGNYILFQSRDREDVVVSDGIRPGWISIPIINLSKKPPFL